MIKKLILILCLLVIASSSALASEMIAGFDKDKDLPMLNEELRRLKVDNVTRVLLWYISGEQETGTDVSARIIIPFPGKIIKAKAYLATAPTAASFLIDINLNGTTLWGSSGKLTILATENSATALTSFDDTAVVEDDYFTVDIDQVGSTEEGEDLTIQLHIEEVLQ